MAEHDTKGSLAANEYSESYKDSLGLLQSLHQAVWNRNVTFQEQEGRVVKMGES